MLRGRGLPRSCCSTKRCATGCSRRRCARRPSSRSSRILHLLDRIGIDTADIGLPGAGPARRSRRRAARARDPRVPPSVRANCAARTVLRQTFSRLPISCRRPVCRSSAAASSARAPIRIYAEGWTVDYLQRCTEEAIRFRRRQGPEGDVRHRGHDPRRSRDAAAPVSDGDRRRRHRVCASPTPSAMRRPRAPRRSSRFVKRLIEASGVDVGIDWHGHRDRDMGDHQQPRRARSWRHARARRRRSASASASATRRWICCW